VTVQHKARVRHDTDLGPNDVVTIAVGKQVRDDALELQGLKIIHLDDAVVVVDKPTGLLSMGLEREKQKTAHRLLNEDLNDYGNRARRPNEPHSKTLRSP